MKKLLAIYVFLGSMTVMTAAPDARLWQSSDPETCVPRFSGMGGLFTTGGQMDGTTMIMSGGSLAFLYQNSFYLGFYGSGLSTDHYRYDLTGIVNIDTPRLAMNHYGVWIGYIHAPEKRLHWGAGMKAGGGRVYLTDPYMYYTPMDEHRARDRVFVLAPQIDLWLNLTCWMSLNLGVGYRYTGGIDKRYQINGQEPVRYYEKADFSTPFVHAGLLFGLYRKPVTT